MILKRAIDIAGALFGLVCLSPIILLAALWILITMGRPIFFRQKRPGLGARPFTMVKFRTMANNRDGLGKPLPDGQRLTRTGRILRSTSVDEIPELWNVLVGDMSLVGPRPLLMSYLDRYTPEQARRHEVKPGVTGWAQVNGRNAISWDEKFELDTWYVDHQSTALDLRILVATVVQVIWRKGINSAEAATMPEFMGRKSLGE